MTNFVLVHGMWHGGWCWKKMTPLLRAAGNEVYTPTLTGLGERVHLQFDNIDLSTHVQDIVNLIEFEDLRDVILVGHSFGGTLVPVIAEKIPDRIAHLVNLDGPVPENGKALKDLIGDYWDFFQKNAIDPADEWRIQPIADWTFGVSGADLEWMRSKLTPHPLKTLTTPIILANPTTYTIPGTFISCAEGISDDEIKAEERRYAGMGWGYRSISTGHDAMITLPEELTKILLESCSEISFEQTRRDHNV
jgi:pimeloyl-ACP methyl ester carboxylesterase